MVLEEITNAVTDAESNVENRTPVLSDRTGHCPTDKFSTQRHRYQTPKISETDENETLSITRRRKTSRFSADPMRQRQSDADTMKRRRDSLPSATTLAENDHPTTPTNDCGILSTLASIRCQDYQLPNGYSIQICVDLENEELRELHLDHQAEERHLPSLETLIGDYRDQVKAALLRFLDSVVGYVLFVQKTSEIGETSAVPLDLLIGLWVVPDRQNRGLERCLLHWWLENSVRDVKYFSLRSATPSMQYLLKSEGHKRPRLNSGEGQENFIAMI